MSDNVELNAGGLKAMEEVNKLGVFTEEGSSSGNADHQKSQKHKFSFSENEAEDEEQKACRICHEEDLAKNLEAPCACNGSLKMAHRACIQRWCNEKQSIICEICKQPYREGYKLSRSVYQTIIDMINVSYDLDEMAFSRNRLFPTAERHPLFDRYDGITAGDRGKATVILAILLISMDLMMIWLAFQVMVDQLGSMPSIICLLIFAIFMLIYTLIWISNDLSGHRRLTLDSARASTRLTTMHVGMPIPHSMHRRRVMDDQTEFDEDNASDTTE